MRHQLLDTPTGPFALIEDDDGQLSTTWVTPQTRHLLDLSRKDRALRRDLVSRLERYFAGDEVDFGDVPTPTGGAFFERCWKACRRVPRGRTISYAQLAAKAGSPEAFRAAGQAMRSNRLPVIIPCHRVIGSTGRLHGFGGTCDGDSPALRIKTTLLRMEGAIELEAACS